MQSEIGKGAGLSRVMSQGYRVLALTIAFVFAKPTVSARQLSFQELSLKTCRVRLARGWLSFQE